MSLLLFQVYKLRTSVYAEAAVRRVLLKKCVMRNFEEFTRISLLINLLTLICSFIKNKSLAQVFSCEFCDICKSPFFAEHHRTTASYYSCINSSEGRIMYKTVNYDTKSKAKQSPRGVPWNGVLRNFTKFTGKYLGLPATVL